MKTCVKMLIFHIFCANVLLFTGKNFFIFFSLLFYGGVLKCICKSVVHTSVLKNAHHFPPYHIGKSLGTFSFRGSYRFCSFLILILLRIRLTVTSVCVRAAAASAAATRFTFLFLSDQIHDDADNRKRNRRNNNVIYRFHFLSPSIPAPTKQR